LCYSLASIGGSLEISFLAASRFSLALASDTSGYVPHDNNFSYPQTDIMEAPPFTATSSDLHK